MRHFTDEEIEMSAQAPEAWKNIKPAQLFSKKADVALALQVAKRAPVLYDKLKTEYLYSIGQLKRPDSHFD